MKSITSAQATGAVRAVVGLSVPLTAHDGDAEPTVGARIPPSPYPTPPGYPCGF